VKKFHTLKKYLFIIVFFSFLIQCKKEKPTLFVALDSKQTGINFMNTITENDTLNILKTEFLYNGGGVGIGDLNGDGLQDVYFTGNQVDNKLYLNRGNLKFEDVTIPSNTQKSAGQWSSGINILDLNCDGKQDLYICNTFLNNPEKRKNFLYINQGNDAQGIPKFKEMATDYGLADTTHSANAQFFDYDNDGDLDLFISTNFMDRRNPSQYVKKKSDGTDINRDRLYRNDANTSLGHPFFTEVTESAGLIWEGYSHSALIMDFNEDGYSDIYVANDYVTNDLVYVNQKNGTFKNEAAAIFKHQPYSSMGSDVADVNNDGLLDIFTTEMLPYYNKRKKLFLNGNSYATYVNNEQFGYEFQYTRNMLQLNRGANPETGLPIFSDVAFYAGVQETDWSWTPLLADFDGDGLRDLFVTNGFPRDVTDHDFGAYRSQYNNLWSPMELQDFIPQIKVPKFAFKNEGNVRFSNQSKDWGVDIAAFSNGAAYSDLDNDGDLDLVVNNINDKAFLFENKLQQAKEKPNYLRIKLQGPAQNPDAFGAKVIAYWGGNVQIAQSVSARGYNSTSENIFHFGLGKNTEADSIKIIWNERNTTFLKKTPANQIFTVVYLPQNQLITTKKTAIGVFQSLSTKDLGLDFFVEENDFADFDIQRTIPHKFSQYGPSMSVADVNGDGLDDIYFSGAEEKDGTWLLQNSTGKFIKKQVSYKLNPEKRGEELGTLLFDADNDGDNDLYLVHGSNEYNAGKAEYQDVFCINDGKGNFTPIPNAIPIETESGSCVKAADFDADGDLDLFVGSRLTPLSYPKAGKSFLLRNDSKGANQVLFTDVTSTICPEITNIGLISDALWTDFNNDDYPDLMLAGEWMPLTFFENQKGKFKNTTQETGVADKLGWWTSLSAADYDNDGDMDYIAGNYGQNLYFQGSATEPMTMYAKDFDKNNSYDAFISCYGVDSLGVRHEYFYPNRDDMVKQLIQIKRKFLTYGAFGEATVQEIFSKEELKDAQILKTNWLASSFVENKGNGKFELTALPYQAQMAPIFGTISCDIDADGLLDILMIGNDFGMELLQGRADAFNGLVLKNKGNCQFKALELNESRFFIPNDARALVRINNAKYGEIILASQNRGALKAFVPLTQSSKTIVTPIKSTKAEIRLKNGQKRKQEFYFGNTFMSQSSRSVRLDASILEVVFN
jgi:enediyne biosynthesis protein E4